MGTSELNAGGNFAMDEGVIGVVGGGGWLHTVVPVDKWPPDGPLGLNLDLTFPHLILE